MAGHGHDDGDADIGTASSHICNLPLPSFESLRMGLKEAFKTTFASSTEVFQLIGITDYDAMFQHEIQEMSQSISGIYIIIAIVNALTHLIVFATLRFDFCSCCSHHR